MKNSRSKSLNALAGRVDDLEAESSIPSEAPTPSTDPIFIELPQKLWGLENLVGRHFEIYKDTCPPEIRERLQWSRIIVSWRGYAPKDRAALSPEEVARCEEGRRQWLMDVWTRAGLSEVHIAYGKIEALLWPKSEIRESLIVVGRHLSNGRELDDPMRIATAIADHKFKKAHAMLVEQFFGRKG